MSDKPPMRFRCPMNPILLSDPPQKLSDTPPVTLPMLKRVYKPRFTHICLHNVSDAYASAESTRGYPNFSAFQ